MPTSLLQPTGIEEVSKEFGTTAALLGPSGSGKTTLRILGG